MKSWKKDGKVVFVFLTLYVWNQSWGYEDFVAKGEIKVDNKQQYIIVMTTLLEKVKERWDTGKVAFLLF